ncbi:uncharacterized protein (DUF2236 family) [Caulobacter ginsengisoli]|uniref:Uncharacterized protein (DUF2236 family) n=1 Tax=Caulobacter ginsengisoli TaxID=400775 RepID=A0ABU0IXZ6_9CAUL|nr:oxygenase MpaB family protein [Caulobacter ginsengisoli]MDQ0465827.1 uncharacterized protein (DUF2236 family) [Caulobacter ginsengisoli]
MKTATLPKPLQSRLDAAASGYASGKGMPTVDFTAPAGEAALAAPDSVSWRVFKNPIALYIGGITAVLLELAEPRVRSGVWDHTSFRTDPLPRMQRTGLAAMMTVYGPRSAAEKMIAGVGRMHARVKGQTPAGVAYGASDPELLDWVQATASFGFMNAYHRFVRPLSQAERDRFYAEAAPAAKLYGATGAPGSEAELEAQFEAMRPKLERSEIVFEFLDIMKRTAALPGPLRLMQPVLMRAAIDILPGWTRDILGLDASYGLKPWQTWLVAMAGKASDRLVIKAAPPAQACVRMGLPPEYLYRHP